MKMKPCPFCGKIPVCMTWGSAVKGHGGAEVQCACGAAMNTHEIYRSPHQAARETIKAWNTREGRAEIPAQMQVLGYLEDVCAIVYSLPCGHEVTWVTGEMRRCPICGAVNEQWPKVVE